MENRNERQLQQMVESLSVEPKSKAGLFLCTSGEAEVMIGKRIYKIFPGVLYVISPIIVIVKLSQSADFGGVYILDRLEVFFPMVRSFANTIVGLRVYNNPCQVLEPEEIRFVLERDAYIRQKQHELSVCTLPEERMLRTRAIELIKQQTMLEVVCIYLRGRELHPHREDAQEGKVFMFLLLLHKHFHAHRDVGFYADEVGLSAGRFSHIIRQKTGITPSAWIARATISYIQTLLRETQMTIKEIAAELNFPEQFTFRKYFKTHVGVSPREYRRQYGMNKSRESLQDGE